LSFGEGGREPEPEAIGSEGWRAGARSVVGEVTVRTVGGGLSSSESSPRDGMVTEGRIVSACMLRPRPCGGGWRGCCGRIAKAFDGDGPSSESKRRRSG
jgi:hypothetical protein